MVSDSIWQRLILGSYRRSQYEQTAGNLPPVVSGNFKMNGANVSNLRAFFVYILCTWYFSHQKPFSAQSAADILQWPSVRNRWGSLQRSPDPLAGLRGPTSKGRKGERRGTVEGGDGREICLLLIVLFAIRHWLEWVFMLTYVECFRLR